MALLLLVLQTFSLTFVFGLCSAVPAVSRSAHASLVLEGYPLVNSEALMSISATYSNSFSSDIVGSVVIVSGKCIEDSLDQITIPSGHFFLVSFLPTADAPCTPRDQSLAAEALGAVGHIFISRTQDHSVQLAQLTQHELHDTIRLPNIPVYSVSGLDGQFLVGAYVTPDSDLYLKLQLITSTPTPPSEPEQSQSSMFLTYLAISLVCSVVFGILMIVVSQYVFKLRRGGDGNINQSNDNNVNQGGHQGNIFHRMGSQVISEWLPKEEFSRPCCHNDGECTTKHEHEHDDDGENQDCSICLETFQNGDIVITTPCKHAFHQDCLNAWLERQANCPLCKYHFLLRRYENDLGDMEIQAEISEISILLTRVHEQCDENDWKEFIDAFLSKPPAESMEDHESCASKKDLMSETEVESEPVEYFSVAFSESARTSFTAVDEDGMNWDLQ